MTVGAVPTGLAEGQISVGMADQPPIAWVGVPASVNPAGVIPITGLVRTVAGAPQPAGALGQLWWDEDGAQLYVYTGSEWVVAVNLFGGASVSFPASPAADQIVTDASTGATWRWDAPTTRWVPGATGATFVTQAQLTTRLQIKITRQVWSGGATGVYIPPAGLQYAIVECVGAGGGGGGAWAGGLKLGGGGGGGGLYTRSLFSAAQIGASQNVTAGVGGLAGVAGGASSFGALTSAGGGGSGQTNDWTTVYGYPGAGGTAGVSNDLSISGGAGGWGQSQVPDPAFAVGGSGGAAPIGGGTYAAPAGVGNAQSTAGAAGSPGCGGGGAATNNHNLGVEVPGGVGGDGWVFVTEYSF